MREKLSKIFIVIILVLIFLNLLWLDYQTIAKKDGNFPVSQKTPPSLLTADSKETSETCSESCQAAIVEKVLASLPTLVPQATTSALLPTPGTKQTSQQPKVLYIPLVTSASSVNTAWTDIVPSEFYFNLEDYPGAKEVRFEGYLLALHGSAKVWARIYDSTNARAVDYSEIETQNSGFTRIESSGMIIWRGNNKYTVQLKSLNGTEVQLKEAKLKVFF